MPSFNPTMPAIDANMNGVWSEQDQDQYNKYPYYLEVASTMRRKKYSVWPNLITETVKWKPNMANTLKMVIPEESPLLRQEARPNSIQVAPKTDVATVSERTVEASLAWQRFQSPHMRFLPSYQDFIKEQLVPTRKSVEKDRDWFEECFYRTYMWDYSPRVFVAGYGIVDVPVGRSGTTSNKTAAVLKALANLVPSNGFLTFQHMFDIVNEAEQVIGMTPYSGSNLPGGPNSGIDDKYCLVQSHESFRQWVNDPWVKENRMLTTDIVNQPYKGSPLGSFVSRLERFSIRWSVGDTGAVSLPSPETKTADNNQNELNRTKPNPLYSLIANSELEIAWLVGGSHYKRIETGAPPEFFAGGTGDPQKLAGMNWNGLIYPNKNFIVYEKDSDGNIVTNINEFGHYMRWQGELSCGMIGPNAHNVLPILYRRRSGLSNTLPS